jgi:predicted PurR-regulated permease PerM
VLERLKGYLDQAISSLPNLLLEVSHATASMVATLILAVFMSYNPDALISGGLRFVPLERRGEARRLIRVLEERLRGWMVGAGLAMLFVGTGAGVGLWLLGAPLPITFGLLAGLLNVVPYVGSIVGALLPALLALTISPVKALLVVALFVILNQIDGYIIQPMGMGHGVRMHPVVVLLAFLFLGRLLGAVGLILAVPTLVFLTTIADEMLPREAPAKERLATHDEKNYDSIPS